MRARVRNPAKQRPKIVPLAHRVPLEQRLAYRCLLVASRITRFLAPMWEAEYGLSVADWRVLAVIARYGDVSATEAAIHSSTDPFQITRAADQLVRMRYVRRQVDLADKRKVRLTLTERGRVAHGEIEAVMSRVESHLLDGLERAEQQAVRNGLSLLEERTLELVASALTWKDFK